MGRVRSGRVQESGDISGSCPVWSRFPWVGSGWVPKFGPACNSGHYHCSVYDCAKALCTSPSFLAASFDGTLVDAVDVAVYIVVSTLSGCI